MAKGGATPQKPALTQVQQEALDTLVALKIPAKEAADLIGRAQGNTTSDLVTNALRLRGGVAPRPTVPPPAGAKLQAVGGQPVAPSTGQPSPQPPPSPQQQIPGFGPPGGPAAAPTAQQLQASIQPMRAPVAGLPPMQTQFLPTRAQYAAGAQQPGAMAAAARPNWFWRLMGAGSPPPAPATRPAVPPTTPAVSPSSPQLSMPPPAPVKPRVRVKAAGGMVPTEVPQAKEEKPEIQQASKPEVPPTITTQEEYDKLPSGARFLWHGVHRYRKP